MLSFRSIVFATAAFATITSAFPTPADIDSIKGVIAGLSGSISGAFRRESLEDAVPAGLQPSSLGDIFKKCFDSVELIVVKIGQ